MNIIHTIKTLMKGSKKNQDNFPYVPSQKAAPTEPLTFVAEDGKRHKLHAVLIHPGYGTEYDQTVLEAAGLRIFEKRLVTECAVGDFRSTIRVAGFERPLNSIHFEFRDDEGKFVDIYGNPAFQAMPY